MTKRYFSVTSACLFGLLWLSSGGLPVWAADKPGGGEGPSAPVGAAFPAAQEYRYSAAGKSDPFRPFMETDPAVIKRREEEALKKKVPLKSASASLLQQAHIDHFRLVGIIGNEAGRNAVVIDSTTKKFYPLSVGTFIGLNGGRVSEIQSDRVIVTEPLEAKGKKPQSKRITMRLYKEEMRRP